MKDGLFHFKRFSVAHSESSMKVGVDGVLIGAWADCQGDLLLDVGTGCGVIALMLAQRNQSAKITAIDVDESSVREASENFRHSEWSARLEARLESFAEIAEASGLRFDRIVSNPPYYDSGVRDFSTARNVARHQGELSPAILLQSAGKLLTDNGKISIIVPYEYSDPLAEIGVDIGLPLTRMCLVRNNPRKQTKRAMMEFSKTKTGRVDKSILTMFDLKNKPTEEYLSLCHEFYLKF